MPWVALDDQFLINPKARAAGPDGRSLVIAAMCWAGMQLNDGTFPASDLPTIAALAEVNDPQNVAGRLHSLGLWHPEGHDCSKCRAAGQQVPVPEGHIAIHQYLGPNKSRQQVIADREASAERKRRSREKSHRDSHGTPNGSHGESPPSPSPPLPTGFSSQSSSSGEPETPPPVDNPTTTETSAAANDVPGQVWKEYAQLKYAKQRPGTVENASSWKRTTAKNAQREHAEQAARWYATFDVGPQQLAAWLIDGQASPHAQRRPQEDTPS